MNQNTTTPTMNLPNPALDHDLDQLTQDAKTLMSDTVGLADDKVSEARKHLACLLERSKDLYVVARGKARDRSIAADIAVHEHLYQAIAVGVGVGLLIGYSCASRCHCTSDLSRE